MTIQDRIQLFVHLGEILGLVSARKFDTEDQDKNDLAQILEEAIKNATDSNGWFTDEFVRIAMKSWADALTRENLQQWLDHYEISESLSQKTIAVIMAGNIPMVGFHDLLCILLSGFRLKIKLSHSDEVLMKAIVNVLVRINPDLSDRISLADNKLSAFNAVIATGSNNSVRYFDHYFAKYPNIIRGNRTSIAVLTGNETVEQLNGLADDICLYFGLGCRNVTHVFIPEGYDPGTLLKINEKYAEKLMSGKKYANNYMYNKAILHLNLEVHYDSGFMLLHESDQLFSTVSVLNYSFYKNVEEILSIIQMNSDQIQAVVSISDELQKNIQPGSAQFPRLWDYADDIDTMHFLNSLENSRNE